jgi:prepilin-type N-terminal cleavage/methylation domain-containing protein
MLRRGFTLVELLIVVTIISILTSVVLASLTEARTRAQDTKRKEDLHNIFVALQLYQTVNGYLPSTSSYGESNGGSWDYSSQGGFLTFLSTSNIMPLVPVDPINSGTGDVLFTGSGHAYAYYCYSDGTVSLAAKLSNGTNFWKLNRAPGFTCQ